MSSVPLSPSSHKRLRVAEILIGFSGAVDTSVANSTETYRLTAPRMGHSPTAKNSKTIRIRSASYDGASHTVVLDPISPFALRQPVQLTVYGAGPSALQDSDGRPFDANDHGQPGGHAVATLSRSDETSVATPSTDSRKKME